MSNDNPTASNNTSPVLEDVLQKALRRFPGERVLDRLYEYNKQDPRDPDEVNEIIDKWLQGPDHRKGAHIEFWDAERTLHLLKTDVWAPAKRPNPRVLNPAFFDPVSMEGMATRKFEGYMYWLVQFDRLAEEKKLTEPELRLLIDTFTQEWLNMERGFRREGEKSRPYSGPLLPSGHG